MEYLNQKLVTDFNLLFLQLNRRHCMYSVFNIILLIVFHVIIMFIIVNLGLKRFK